MITQTIELPFRSVDDIDERLSDIRANAALLIRLCEAEERTDRGGTSIELEHDAWRGMRSLMRDTRRKAAEIHEIVDTAAILRHVDENR